MHTNIPTDVRQAWDRYERARVNRIVMRVREFLKLRRM